MDAELLLADMEFHDDESQENVRLKENVIELYNARLDERIRRKKFVIERGLLDLKSVQRTERKYSKEEREIVNKCKIFARFHTKEEHEKFVNGLIKERALRDAIEQLKYFRAKGLTQLDQIEKYIEGSKLKAKQAYEKNYSVPATTSHKKNESSGRLNGKWSTDYLDELQELVQDPDKKLFQAKSLELKGSSSKPLQSHLLNDAKWASLSNKEKTFVQEINMKPTTYCSIKRQIQLEQVKNNKIRLAMLLNNV